MLEVRDLVKHWHGAAGESIRAIDGITFDIADGELFALYGPSGSGKSTLLKLVAALIEPDAGEIVVDGVAVTGLRGNDAAHYRKRSLGFVAQDADLLDGLNAIDNAAIKLVGGRTHWRRARNEVKPLLVDLGLSRRLEHRVEQLSTGERQRVMIARALSTGPRLVLADEPTGNLDRQRSRDTLGLLTEVCREHGAAMLLATHDDEAASFADTVQTLSDGHLAVGRIETTTR
jgi:ABC-type lipoprotein export system ATPase subunit